MNSLTSASGEILSTQDAILEEAKRHYQNLYMPSETENICLSDLLDSTSVPKLNENEKLSIEGALSYSEMLGSLKKMSNNTSPGNDGFTVEFFKFFWKDLGVFLVRSINYAYANGELSVTQKQGVITCIPKGNKDKAFLKNWRPISLLNVSYKIASATIASRIKSLLNNIINEDQTGFLPGRLMASNIRLLYDILYNSDKNNTPGLLLLIDFAAAFDTVSWNFMSNVLNFFNFGPSIQKWIKLFYTNIESCVIINGHMSQWFQIHRGCRQGDALSPYLFILCAEILAILIRKNENIKGIKINVCEYILSQYADDTSLFLDGSKESLQNTIHALKFYGRISGLNINAEKTKVIWIGSRKNSNQILCPELNLSWDNRPFTVLGVKFSTNLRDIIDLNYESKIEEIKSLLACWSKRVITPIGKLVVIKTLALSKLNHLILSIPNPPQEKINKIQNLFFKYLWGNSVEKVKRKIVTQEYKYGGLKMVDLNIFMHSLKLSWLRRLSKMSNKFSYLVESNNPFMKNIYKFGSDYIKRYLHHDLNPFWRDVLISYNKLLLSFTNLNQKQIGSVNIWYNPDIKVGGSSICYRRWLAAGIVFIGDLINHTGELLSYREFNATFNINTNFLEFNGLIRSIKTFLQNKNVDYLPNRNFDVICPINMHVINADLRGCRTIYQHLLKREEFPKTLQKWKSQLTNVPNASILYNESVYDIIFTITKDSKLQWFQYRINHRILGTNYLLKKMNLIQDEMCTFCNNGAETIMHLFWTCQISKDFFARLLNHINNKCNTPITEWTAKDIIFGSNKLDKPINTILLQAKLFLYYSKLKKIRPNFEEFNKQLIGRYQSERFIAIQNFTVQKFEATWGKYKNLLE